MRNIFGSVLRICFGISLLVLAFVVLDIRPADLLRDLAEIDLVLFVIIIVPVFFADRLLMTYKWGLLLKAAGIRIPLLELFNVYMISGFVGAFLPTSIGADLARFYHLHKKNLDYAEVAATIVIERLLGFFAVLTWAIATLPVLAWLHPDSRQLMLLVGGLMVAASLLPLLLVINRPLLRRARKFLPRLVGERLTSVSERLFWAFHAYKRRGRVLLIFFLLSLVESGFPVMINVAFAWLLHLDISWVSIVLVIPAAHILIRLPISFHGVGAFEWSYVSFFALIGVSAEDAFSLGLLADASNFLLSLFGGFFLLYRLIVWRGAKNTSAPVETRADG